jgi:phage shock protein PspC (stress-responsive transcriptional regulator)
MTTLHDSGVGTSVPPPPDAPEQPRRLRRPTDDRVVFGVASGLGRYLDVDPVLVRIGFVLLAVFGGSGVLLYLIGLIAIPEEREEDRLAAAAGPPRPAESRAGQQAALVIGGVLILIGSLNLVGQLVPAARDLFGPAILLAAGALVLVWGGRR